MNLLLINNCNNENDFETNYYVNFIERTMSRVNTVFLYVSDETDYDKINIIVVITKFNSDNLINLNILKNDLPKILFVIQPDMGYVPCSNIWSWVIFKDTQPNYYTNYPYELTETLSTPASILKDNRATSNINEKLNVAFISDNVDINIGKQLISFFNEIDRVCFKMYVREELFCIYSDYINTKIELKSFKNYQKELLNNDLVIGCRKPIIDAITNGIPSVVAGEKGFGGLVNPENIEAHRKNNFNGRIGGTKGERIPINLLSFELEWSESYLNTNFKMLKELALYLHEYNNENILVSKIEYRLDFVFSMHKKINNTIESLMTLKPAIVKNIIIHNNENTYTIKRIGSMKSLLEITLEESILLQLMNGTQKLSTILKHVKVKKVELSKFVLYMWKEKILYFVN